MTTVTAAPVATTAASTTGSSSTSSTVSNVEIASNFTQFLTLLTTELQNQDPLSPMDTTQFTQQLIGFAQVEQQMKSNDSLSTLVTQGDTSQATQAANLVGATAVVDGSSATMTNSSATWTLTSTKPATATITIADSSGATAYSGKLTLSAGTQSFKWNGLGNSGKLWPDGDYTLTATAVDASGQTTTVSTKVQAKIDSADLSKTPPTVSIAGNDYKLSKIQQIVATK